MNIQEKIRDEIESDKILLIKLQKQQNNSKSVVEREQLEERMIEIGGRIDGLNIALKILNNSN